MTSKLAGTAALVSGASNGSHTVCWALEEC